MCGYMLDKKIPRLQTFGLIQAHKAGEMVTAIQSLNMKGKEAVVIANKDCTVKKWCWIKGRLGYLRVIRIKQPVFLACLFGELQDDCNTSDESSEIESFESLSVKLNDPFLLTKRR